MDTATSVKNEATPLYAVDREVVNCKVCDTAVSQNYCPNCGSPVHLTRINGRYVASEIGSVLNFDKGIFYTIQELILRPGVTVRRFVREDRKRLVKPIIFLILTSFIYTVAQRILHFEDGYVSADVDEFPAKKIIDWVQSNYGYANIIMCVFSAMWAKLFFRKSEFNFYEVLILFFFTAGISMLIYTVFGIAESVTGYRVLHVAGVVGAIYSIWAIGRFFDRRKSSSYVKAFLAYFLSFMTFVLLIVVIGVVAMVMMNS